MLKRILCFIFVFSAVLSTNLSAQGIQGKVVDSNGSTVSYASIFIKELTRGTTTNSLGMFSLPLPAGDYTIYFRSLGYTEVRKTVTVSSEMIELQITLPPQMYMIPEVFVTASGEDPAYMVMRKAIGMANYHLNQVKTYEARIYIKGTAYFNKLPRAIAKRIEVNDIKVEEGRAYMLESLNEVSYRAPDKYDMKILASQNTIPGYVESVNPMDYVNASLYQPQIENFVSPLARNAFTYYKFSLEGSFLQGTHMIDKIKVIPRRKSQQLCSGYLYIVEDLWCLHSSDLAVNTIAGVLLLQQQYANVIMDAWLPVSHKLDLNVQLAGVQADVTYVSSLEYTKTQLNPNLPESYFEPITETQHSTTEEQEVSKEQVQIQEILEKEELNDRDMARLTRLMEKDTRNADSAQQSLAVEGTKFTITQNAVINDSSYWNAIRPVPLTLEEISTLAERDSLMGFGSKDTTAINDSTIYSAGKKVTGSDIIFGKLYQSKNRRTRFEHDGLIDLNMLDFNTVDGWSYGQHFSFSHRPNENSNYRSELWAGYSFNRKAPDIGWNSSVLFAPAIRGKIALRLNYRSEDFNETSGIPDLTNMMYSLFYRENHSKRYERRSAQFEYRMDLAAGLVLYTIVDLEDRKKLFDNSDFSFFYRKSKDYFSNDSLIGFEKNDPVLDDSKLLALNLKLEYTYKYYYRLRYGRKQYFKSDYPTLQIQYRHAVPIENNGWANYSLLSGGIKQTLDVGLLSELNYELTAGYFLNQDAMHISDYVHFKSSPLLMDIQGFQNSFMLLDYFRASTNEYYVQGHASLSSSYLLIKQLPWFSERLWSETLSVAFLNTPQVNNYIQLAYSLNEIGFMLDLGVFTAIENWKYYGTGFRINFRF